MWLCRQVYAEEGYLGVNPSGCWAPKEVPAQCSPWALAWMLPGTACVEAGRVAKQSLRGGQLSAMAALQEHRFVYLESLCIQSGF